MVKTLLGLVPLAIGFGLYGLAVWYLLAREVALGRWLLGAFLVGHGLVHVMFTVTRTATVGATSGADYPFDVSSSWLARGFLDGGQVQALVMTLVVMLVVAFTLAGLATAGILVPPTWWGPLVVVGSALSLVMLLIAASPGLAIGYVIDGLLLVVVLASIWSPPEAATR